MGDNEKSKGGHAEKMDATTEGNDKGRMIIRDRNMVMKKVATEGKNKREVGKDGSVEVNKNTSDYLWRTDSGQRSMEVETRRGASSYVVKIMKMKEEK